MWGTAGPGLSIVVVPPFWRTWWFVSLMSLAAATLVLVAHQRRVQRLRAQHAMQAAFSRQLIDSQEGERRRLSSEMHDSLGQHLAIIKRHARVGVESANGADSLRETFQDIATVADGLNEDLKAIATGLRPYQLDAIGLSKTIEGMVHRVGRACDIEFESAIAPIDDVYPQDLQIHIYRIVQESVNNIVKHSRARRARVDVMRDTGSVEIRIEDDGVGVGAQSNDGGRRGFGLMGIRERAQILGGTVDIQSARGGTTVVVTLPLNGVVRE
jgi:signal transduction histidine kinase